MTRVIAPVLLLLAAISTSLSGCAVAGMAGAKPNCKALKAKSTQGPMSTVYFGCGCFWHMQYAFVSCAEEGILGRTGNELTSYTGYAGSTHVGDEGKVCYHNYEHVGDYGALGHAEVVSLDMPDNAAESIFELYLGSACLNGNRQDPQDYGSEYRSLVGFPGGLQGDLGKRFVAMAQNRSVQVATGEGSDGDDAKVWVMDTAKFPFHQAELYHQFHDDMIDAYSTTYHKLKDVAVERGALKATGCPNDVATLYL